jgi:hypothetical protein
MTLHIPPDNCMRPVDDEHADMAQSLLYAAEAAANGDDTGAIGFALGAFGLGRLSPRGRLYLTTLLGTATSPDGRAYELLLINGFTPALRGADTGETFVLPWDDIVRMALAHERGRPEEAMPDGTPVREFHLTKDGQIFPGPGDGPGDLIE